MHERGSGVCDVAEFHYVECFQEIKGGQCSQIHIANYIVGFSDIN